MMESKDFIPIISVKLKNENGNLVSFIGQSITFRLSIQEVYFFSMLLTLVKSRYQTQLTLENKILNNKNKINHLHCPQIYKLPNKNFHQKWFYNINDSVKFWSVLTTISKFSSFSLIDETIFDNSNIK